MSKEKILIVDDEPDILEMLAYNLGREGYEVLTAPDGEDAIRLTVQNKPDLILLDIMMPQMDGVETCRRIRELPSAYRPFIIFLTARSEEYSEIAGLEAGGDDYISKPIKMRLLISHIQAILRRKTAPAVSGTETVDEKGNRLIFGELEISGDEYLVFKKGKEIGLPKKEFELLFFLASRPGKVFSREALLEHVWGSGVSVVDRTVDVHVRKLREKLGKKYIHTIKGVGYKFTTGK